jgi:hypothetical protein
VTNPIYAYPIIDILWNQPEGHVTILESFIKSVSLKHILDQNIGINEQALLKMTHGILKSL